MTQYSPQHPVQTTDAGQSPTDPGPDAGVKDKAAASAEAGKQAASDVAQTATDKAKDVAQEAGNQARQVLSEAQNKLGDHARDQHQNAVQSLRSLGDELNSMAQRSDQSGPASDLVSQAGSRVASAASWLDAREPGDLIEEVRQLARKRPGAFLIGALAAGVLAGRLTRGVVAAHQDDDSADSVSPAASPAAEPTAPPIGAPAAPAPPPQTAQLPPVTTQPQPADWSRPATTGQVYP